MSNKHFKWLAIFILPLFFSCYPNGAEYAEELDIVYTNYYDQFDFKSKTTYAIPDSVIKVDGDSFDDPDGDGKPKFVKAEYSNAILARINQNMQAAGWTRVDKYADPDVIVLVASMVTTNIYYYYDWWYWGYWYPYWDPWWGWYYPCCYYPGYVSGYRSGSILMQMVDNGNVPVAGDNIPVVWTGIMNGLAEGNTASITTRIEAGVDQAFAQSPYLKH